MVIFTMLIRPVHEPEKSFYSFYMLISSTISFFNELMFLSYKSFSSLVRVTPRWFTLLEAIGTGVVSLISFSDWLSFVYSCATNFCEIILFPNSYWKCLSDVGVYWRKIWGNLCILSYHLQIKLHWVIHFKSVLLWSSLVVLFF